MPAKLSQRLNGLPDRASQRELRAVLEAVIDDLSALTTQLNQLRADYNAHVHGGVTAGAASTAATAATTATAVAQTLTK